MQKRGKKGISPLIATILIIGFTIVLAALVMQWGTTLLKSIQAQSGKTAEVKITCSGISNLEVIPLSPNEIRVNNNNDIRLEGFLFRSYVGDKVITTDIPVPISKLESNKFIILTDYSKGIPNKVGVFPKIMTSDGKIATCDYEFTKDITPTPTKSGIDLTWASQVRLTQLSNLYLNGKLDTTTLKSINYATLPPVYLTTIQTPKPGDGSSVSILAGTLSIPALNIPASGQPPVPFNGIINGNRLALTVYYINPDTGLPIEFAMGGSLADTNGDGKIDTSDGSIAAKAPGSVFAENVYVDYTGKVAA